MRHIGYNRHHAEAFGSQSLGELFTCLVFSVSSYYWEAFTRAFVMPGIWLLKRSIASSLPALWCMDFYLEIAPGIILRITFVCHYNCSILQTPLYIILKKRRLIKRSAFCLLFFFFAFRCFLWQLFIFYYQTICTFLIICKNGIPDLYIPF